MSRSPESISAQYKAKRRLLCQQLGHNLTSTDPEFWLLGDWLKAEYQKGIDERNRGARIERQLEVAKEYPEIACRKCGGPIERSGRRGRPRLEHDICPEIEGDGE